MPDFITQAGIVFASGLALVALLVFIQIVGAFRDAHRYEREEQARVRRGLCPYCDAPLAPAPATNCPECRNWIKGARDCAARAGISSEAREGTI
jgi:hypothetical protein